MSNLQTPTTKDISDNLVAQMQANLNQVIPLAPKSFIRVVAKVSAGVFILLYKYGGYISLQMFVSTAGLEETEVNGVVVSPLTEWGRLVGAGDPVAATQAELSIAINVETQGGTMPTGTQLVGDDNGVVYVTTSAIALNSATVVGPVRAVSDQTGGDGSGTIGNLEPGGTMGFANPLGQVSSQATVTSATVVGADAETAAAYRQRVLNRFQKRPQGGAYADYEVWGLTVEGVIGIFPYTSNNPGQVEVYVEVADLTDGIPVQSQLDAVASAIEFDDAGLATRRPAGAQVTTLAITRTEFAVEVTGLSVTSGEAQVKEDIETGVSEYFTGRAPFIVGLSPLPRKDRITDSGVTSIVEDIVNAAGGVFTDVEIDAGAVTLYTLGEGEKAKSSLVTFA